MGDLSAHFSKAEFACRCCGELKIDKRLIAALEQLRALAGTAILIHDGYRCPGRNQEVGGVTDSEHTRGLAADVGIPGLSLQQMYDLALQIPTFAAGGIGVYDGGFLHLDVRSYPARWSRVRGQYVSVQHLVKQPLTLLAKVETSSQPG
jgi:zinc D-Ala-D-Ala carboxypeptidase